VLAQVVCLYQLSQKGNLDAPVRCARIGHFQFPSRRRFCIILGMGLTIHYIFKAVDISTDKTKSLVCQLHAAALDLPFDHVSQIVEVLKSSRSSKKSEVSPEAHLLKARAIHPVIATFKGGDCGEILSPNELIGFIVQPAEGCEVACFGLARYPTSIIKDGQSVSTDLDGWRWWCFCKTQYASNPSLGGVKQFLRCHLGIVALLDKAKDLGILDEVKDEGGYWEKRDVEALVKEIARWNTMVAGFVGRLNDHTEKAGRDRRSVASAITEFPDFEHLEAEGRAGENGQEGT
jgi:hypothetical protein